MYRRILTHNQAKTKRRQERRILIRFVMRAQLARIKKNGYKAVLKWYRGRMHATLCHHLTQACNKQQGFIGRRMAGDALLRGYYRRALINLMKRMTLKQIKGLRRNMNKTIRYAPSIHVYDRLIALAVGYLIHYKVDIHWRIRFIVPAHRILMR